MRGLIFGALALLLPTLATAQTIPGADDPRLRAAALAWLNDEDPAADVRRLGELAAEGNIAAQLFINRVVLLQIHFDFPLLDRKERLALLAPGDDPDRFRYGRYLIDRELVPKDRMWSAETQEELAEAGQTLLDAGQRDRALWNVAGMPMNRPDIDIEAVKWAETWVSTGEQAKTVLWAFRISESRLLEYSEESNPAKVAERRARWGEPPWNSRVEQEFLQALSEGRWTAIYAALLTAQLAPDLIPPGEQREKIERWHDIWLKTLPRSRGDAPNISPTELESLGQAILDDAEDTPFLWPLRNACRQHCSGEIRHCVATTAVKGMNTNYSEPGMEPVLTTQEYFASNRAARSMLYRLGFLRNHPDESTAAAIREQTEVIPGCLRDAADRLTEPILRQR
ncbi:hypothetical protein ACW9UR_09770 [Halovulum sp. GXIMD14794]